ncbi:MAG: MBL fold metallo-hydrolase [Pseudomonadales bacterium]|nr:MBL fold metallo-hydrolase [Pseudomonadales bacterium]
MKKSVILVFVAVLGLVITLLGCFSAPKRQAYVVPEAAVMADWGEIRRGASQVAFKTLLTGLVKVPVSGMLNLDNPKTMAYRQEKAAQGGGLIDSVDVEVYAHWIRHPEKGDIFIDSGLDARFRDTARGSLKGLVSRWIVEDSVQLANQDILSQIEENDINVKMVFLTHVHGDHSSGLPVLPLGIPVVLGKNASLHQYPLIMYNDHFDNVAVLQTLDFDGPGVVNVEPLGKMIDLLGDGSLWAISTPGHTNGHISYLVNSTEGWVLLTGDASHTRWGFENDVIPGWSEDEDEARKSLEALRTFSLENNDVRVVFGHER